MSRRMPSASISEVVHQCGGTIRLRYQLAQDGCTESQFSVAKSLLNEANNCEDLRVNGSIAVRWLLLAAEKGHPEAFCLLRQCYVTGVGVTKHNRLLVEECLRLTETEIIALRVGHNLFAAIMSDTEDTIAEEIFQEKVNVMINQEIIDYSDSNKSDSESGVKLPKQKPLMTEVPEACATEDEKHISVGDIVSSVQQCLEGNLPFVALKHVAQYEEYNKWFSLKYTHMLKHRLCQALEVLVKDVGSPVLPVTIFFCSILLWAVASVLTVQNELTLTIDKYRMFFASAISLVTMMACSCYIIFLSFGYDSVDRWLVLVKLFEPSVKSEEAKQKYSEKAKFPIFIFFMSSFIFNILQPFGFVNFISKDVLLCSLFMLFLLDRTIISQRYYVNISLILNILLCLHKENLLKAPGLEWMNFLNFEIALNIYKGYEIHISWISCITLPFVLPYLYIKMGLGSGRRGWYSSLLPHLMTLTWLNIASSVFKSYETSDFFWSLCFWFSVLLLTSYIGALPSLVVASLCKGLNFMENWSYVTILLLGIFFTFSYFVCTFLVKKMQIVFKSHMLILLLPVMIALCAFVKASPVSGSVSDSSQVLSWDKYEAHCHRYAWYKTNPAEVEVACLPLKGQRIAVDGTVMTVDVVQVENRLSHFTSILPSPLSDWVVCALGERFCSNQNNLSQLEKERCALYESLNINECHLHNWNVYEYRMTLEVSTRTSPEVTIRASHLCTPFIKSLKEGDFIHIVGILEDSLGSTNPEISMLEAACKTCSEHASCKTLPAPTQFDYSSSVPYLVKFYLSPFIRYNNN